MASIELRLNGLAEFGRILQRDLRRRTNGPIRQAFNEMGEIYRRYLLERYDRLSAGGGTWPPNAKSTVRKKGHGKILKEKGYLREAFSPHFIGKPGQLNEHVPFGVRVGIGGGQHPSGISMRQLVEIHQEGWGHNPVRRLVVSPTAPVQNQMAAALRRASRKLIKDTMG